MPSRNVEHPRKGAMPPPSLVAALRAKLGLPRKTFSRLTGFSERAIADWEKGKAISEPGLRRMREIERLQERLAEVVNRDSIPQWLETPNPGFEGLKPLEVIERGEIDRLWTVSFRQACMNPCG
jgi:transcriptional regulator with XRE-family HTH domain